MSLVPFIVVTLGGAVAALATRRWRRVSLTIGLGGLLLATVAALLIVPGDAAIVGSGRVETTDFGRLFLVLGAFTGLLIAIVALATEWRPDLPAALLGGFGTLAVALAIGDPTDALLALLIGTLAITLVTLSAPVAARDVTIASRELRAIVVAGVLAIVGMAWVDRPIGTPPPDVAVYGLAFLAVAFGTAIRFGAIPFHRWAARLSDAAPEPVLPLLLAWAPAGFAIVALAWMDRSVAPLLLQLGVERALVVTVAVLTIVFGAVGAWLQDDLEHVVGYSILQDAGFIVLGLSILDPAAWQPTRAWILVFVVVKTAFAAWAIALRTRFDSRRIPELGGWARRAPLLAISLLLIVVATIGVPGLLSWDVRSDLIELAVGTGPMGWIVLLGGLASLTYYGRIALVGARVPSTLVAAGHDERVRLAVGPLTDASPGTAEVPASADQAGASAPDPAGSPVTDASPPATRRRPRGRAGSGGVGAAWRANRAPIASTLVLALAIVALGVGIGGLGGPDAAAAPAPDPGVPSQTSEPIPSDGSPVPGTSGPASTASPEPSSPGSGSAPPSTPNPTSSGGTPPAPTASS